MTMIRERGSLVKPDTRGFDARPFLPADREERPATLTSHAATKRMDPVERDISFHSK
jgi:hypothetical protein